MIEIFRTIKNNFSLIVFGLLAIFVFRACDLKNKLIAKDHELGIAMNNYEAYQGILNNQIEKNRVLKLNMEQMQTSQDSLLVKLEDSRKKLKIKDKGLKQAQAVSVSLQDSAKSILKTDSTRSEIVNFRQELKLNELTKVIVDKKDSLLTVKLDIRTDILLWVHSKKQYRNHYKTIFGRLIHFDFKKDVVNTYTVESTNDLIKIKDVRVIDLE